MQRITSATVADLHDIAATRRVEQRAAAALPDHALMQRAGLAVARLAMAIAPHARTIWIACGPGNNGGDGFEAAAQLQVRGFQAVVTRIGDDAQRPPDARRSLQRARDAGVAFRATPPESPDLCIDALLGIGAARAPSGEMAAWLRAMDAHGARVLSVDTPSALNADTGMATAEAATSGGAVPAIAVDSADTAAKWPSVGRPTRWCLSLLTLKPGLFTGQGRDLAGEVWFDDLGVAADEPPTARLAGATPADARLHASHKGSYGDVAVIGGAPGMTGAGVLAATAALHGGAGRVFAALLDPTLAVDLARPELMFRRFETLDLAGMTAVCGCGGGSAVEGVLREVLAKARALVLDADALNAVASNDALARALTDRGRAGRPTVLTPHPLEAARLLGVTTTQLQSDRLRAAGDIARRFGATVVLKGSGTVIADGQRPPVVNASGNARLASAGTGDVLAGMIGAALAAGHAPFDAAVTATWRHGDLADRWPADRPLTAGALALGAPPGTGDDGR